MEIDAVRVWTRQLKRADPSWRTASYSASDVFGVYVGIESDGVVGVGATSAHPRRISAETLVSQLSGQVAAALTGQPVERARPLIAELAEPLHPRAGVAVDLALYDLIGKASGVPAEVLWGGPVRDRITVVRMVGIKPPEEIVEAVTPLYASGLRAFKLKLGAGVERDVECVARVRAAFADVTLTVDANGAYDGDAALRLCRGLADLSVMCVEQPMNYGDLDGMATLRAASPVALMADQLVETAEDAVVVGRARAADMVSLKLTKMGSVVECVRVANVCAAMGLGVHLGGSAAPSIVDSALTRLALACPDVDIYAEVGESAGLIDDTPSGVVYTDAWAYSDGQPGLGGWVSVAES